MTDLVERLRDTRHNEMSVSTCIRLSLEAATAIEAKDAEIAALRGQVKELEAHNKRLGQGGAERYWEERYRDEVICAEVAERKLTEAIEALKSLIAICERNIYPQPDEPESYWAKLCAARAVTGE